MISKDEAIKIAKENSGAFNYCTEYEKAYLFSDKDSKSFGGSLPVAVMKDTGECFNMTHFIDNVEPGAIIEEAYI